MKLRQQRLYLYTEGRVKLVSAISSGKDGYRTPTGSFRVIRKKREHISSVYGDYVDGFGHALRVNVDRRIDPMPSRLHFRGARMPYFVEFAPGYGFHAGQLSGSPNSHGCVRLPSDEAMRLFESVDVGSPIRITN